MIRRLSFMLAVTFLAGVAMADEAPISGTVKAVDPAAKTVTIESTAKGKTRQVVVQLVRVVLER